MAVKLPPELDEPDVSVAYRWARRAHERLLGTNIVTVEELKGQGWIETGTVHPYYGSVLMLKVAVIVDRCGHA